MSLSSFLSRVAEQPATNDGSVIVIVAIVGAIGTVAAAWAQGNRIHRQATAANEKADVAQELAAEVADSVGPKNGHGTVQDVTGVLLSEIRETRGEVAAIRSTQQQMHRSQHAMQTSIDSVVVAADSVNDRLKGHDREIAALKHRKDEP